MFLQDFSQLIYPKPNTLPVFNQYHALVVLFASFCLLPLIIACYLPSVCFVIFLNPYVAFWNTSMVFIFHSYFHWVSLFSFSFCFAYLSHLCLFTLSLVYFSLPLLVLSPFFFFVSGLLSYHCPYIPLTIVLYLLSSYLIYYSLFLSSLYNHCALELWPWGRLHCTKHYRNTKQIMFRWPKQPDIRE